MFTSIILGFFVYLKDYKAKMNRTFTLFCFSVAFWSAGYYLWQISIEGEEALFWSRVLMAGATFIPIFYLHFVLHFLDIYKDKKRTLFFGYFLFFIFFFLDFTPYIVKEVRPALSFEFWPKPGAAFHPFLALWFFYTSYSTYLLLCGYKFSSGIKRVQIKFILLGMIIGFIGGSTNYLLWYGIQVPPIANPLVALYVVMVTIAVLKYNLMNIKVIAAELLTSAIIIVLSSQVFFAKTLLDGILRFIFLLLVTIFGLLLIHSVKGEVRRREEVEQLSRELAIANEKLKEMDRAKTDFLSIASHQLRSPLTVIKVGVGALLDGTFGPVKEPKQIFAMNKIFENADRLIGLIGDYLNISRIEMGKIQYNFKETDVGALVKEITEEYKQRAATKGLKLSFKSAKKMPLAICDDGKIREVITNIIDNSIKYTSAGSVEVKCEYITPPAPLTPVVERSAFTTGQALRGEPREGITSKGGKGEIGVSVKDTGLGLDSEEMKIIFQKFRRASDGNLRRREGEPVEGSGLGLYVAKMFLEAHGGKIWVESEGKGKGSTFYFVLPLKPTVNPAVQEPLPPVQK
ncbi:MAG: ATP-binding protein [bacterium]|nr:ATP-binding protein [bacterium]